MVQRGYFGEKSRQGIFQKVSHLPTLKVMPYSMCMVTYNLQSMFVSHQQMFIEEELNARLWSSSEHVLMMEKKALTSWGMYMKNKGSKQ